MEILHPTFKGSNEYGEIETAEEFYNIIKDKDASTVDLSCFTFTQVDLSNDEKIRKEDWDKFQLAGAAFYGCELPKFTNEDETRRRGAYVQSEPTGIPFKVFRAFMYKQEELQKIDAETYEFYKTKTDLRSILAQNMHDYFIQDALFDYLEGKTVVVIMGGHKMLRASSAYRDVVMLGYKLARNGFVVATGGGPGAMEASNLGAYLFEKSEQEVEEALQILRSIENKKEHEYLNFEAAKAVIERFGQPTIAPSLGIPTYRYGHEPSNMFATNVAKMFSNAVREAGLINIGNGGIIYTPGSAGTRQEIFQASCQNHYSEDGKERPSVFYDKVFWKESKIVTVLKENSKDRPFAKLILESDSVDEIVKFHCDFRNSRNLPVLTLEQLKCNHWERRTGGACYTKMENSTDLTLEPPTKKKKVGLIGLKKEQRRQKFIQNKLFTDTPNACQ
mmetsp:Transcript_20875/g.25277  ORF Transcript_20875/g.25277 Transcript_20875/m.25277 type:complete len:447 (+) Transcript_20875:342-1682(+)|eukprot:CAMPEP_0204827392 /NCGR_PEP_ID=MMETSP1346-20131115/4864_1 /ASSEMBLY_ACC=CAM_ASM_000771 /TAXON_ID=215587 /ORGANISM="Aplanochytrium stocchinoi, Strain GSBS06" /LENGTH=446 /DNA_ID=CAMNT_0051955801 /DNA_START=308 /DNA_END=1648 /DNA_ORIENTATION=-